MQLPQQKESRALKNIAWAPPLMFLAALGINRTSWPGTNLYVLQAGAWLSGAMTVSAVEHDVAVVGGNAYVPFPPFPSVLLLPLVAALGVERVPMRLTASLIALIGVSALWRLLGLVGLRDRRRAWLVAAFFLGTGIWSCVALSGGVWFFAHVVAVTCMLLAIQEALGRQRAMLVGLWAGLAFLSRQLAVYSLVFLLATLWKRAEERGRRRQMFQVGLALGTFGLGAATYLVYNWLRFDHPLETGYSFIPLGEFLAARVERHGLFHLAYAPFNFIHMFLQGPSFVFEQPALLRPVSIDGMGTSLTVASPFIFTAFAARGCVIPLRFAWLSVGLALTHMLLYYNNGFVQLNTQRFTLDFLPVMITISAVGVSQSSSNCWKPLAIWAVGLNGFALVALPYLRKFLGGIF